MDSASVGSTQGSSSTSNKSFCQTRKSENGSFISELKIYFHDLITSSMDDLHKACFSQTFHKAYDQLKKLGDHENPNLDQDEISPLPVPECLFC